MRVSGMLQTRITAALNLIVMVHKPAALRIERLRFLLALLSHSE